MASTALENRAASTLTIEHTDFGAFSLIINQHIRQGFAIDKLYRTQRLVPWVLGIKRYKISYAADISRHISLRLNLGPVEDVP